MINPEQIRMISDRLFKFVSVPHEGLGPDEQSILMTDCKLIEQLAIDIDNWRIDTVNKKAGWKKERSNDGKA